MLKLINFYISSIVPQKLYWYLAGLINPWQAVLENATTPHEVFKRSKDIVSILEKLQLINKKNKVLDIGCGVGRAEFILAKKVQECTGIDISASMISLAKNHSGSHNVSFFTTNGKDLKIFPKNKFNLVFSILVFQHLPREIFLNYLKEAKRVLKNNGKICFQIPIYFNQKPKEPPKSHPWAMRFYSLIEMENILKQLNFKKIKFLSVGGNKLKVSQSQALVIAEKLSSD